ncbi:hypothetical protein [Phormidium sp. CCY1219]|uniref:hypothetical protein n=1 Tax=Phormidium sp. CCY1219 TaxID=2886104 RepID=UPI002D1F60DE|nr:hypothetical protein [Phormidium sp. CCY1219]MEB3826693.1 hypothetical protein [Phormidium sp. CCY1219]
MPSARQSFFSVFVNCRVSLSFRGEERFGSTGAIASAISPDLPPVYSYYHIFLYGSSLSANLMLQIDNFHKNERSLASRVYGCQSAICAFPSPNPEAIESKIHSIPTVPNIASMQKVDGDRSELPEVESTDCFVCEN